MERSCECRQLCVHGERCLGGHVCYPDSHWYPCQKCTPTTKTTMKELRAAHRRRQRKLKRR